MQDFFADRTGLEPATSAVTGRHSNQLNYRSKFLFKIFIGWTANHLKYFLLHLFSLFSNSSASFLVRNSAKNTNIQGPLFLVKVFMPSLC